MTDTRSPRYEVRAGGSATAQRCVWDRCAPADRQLLAVAADPESAVHIAAAMNDYAEVREAITTAARATALAGLEDEMKGLLQ